MDRWGGEFACVNSREQGIRNFREFHFKRKERMVQYLEDEKGQERAFFGLLLRNVCHWQ